MDGPSTWSSAPDNHAARGALPQLVVCRKSSAATDSLDDVGGATPLSMSLATAQSRAEEQQPPSDMALRAALDSLDAARQKQPSMDDFVLENYLGRSARRTSSGASVRSVIEAVAACWHSTSQAEDDAEGDDDDLDSAVDSYLLRHSSEEITLNGQGQAKSQPKEGKASSACYTADMLLAAVRSKPILDASRNTSPGSTAVSSLGGSASTLSSSDSGAAAATERRPRRPGSATHGSARGHAPASGIRIAAPRLPPKQPGRRPPPSARMRAVNNHLAEQGRLSAR